MRLSKLLGLLLSIFLPVYLSSQCVVVNWNTIYANCTGSVNVTTPNVSCSISATASYTNFGNASPNGTLPCGGSTLNSPKYVLASGSGDYNMTGLQLGVNWPNNSSTSVVDITFSDYVCTPVTFSVFDLNYIWDGSNYTFLDKIVIDTYNESGGVVPVNTTNFSFSGCTSFQKPAANTVIAACPSCGSCSQSTTNVSLTSPSGKIKRIRITYTGSATDATGTYSTYANPDPQYIIISNITAKPSPHVTPNASGTICAGSPFNLSSSSTIACGTVSSYSWTSSPAGFTSSSQSPGNVIPAGTTTYSVVATSNAGCTSPPVTTTATVTPLGAGTITPPYSICDGDVLSVSSSATTGTYTDLSYSFNAPGPPWTSLGNPSPFNWTSTGFGGNIAYLQSTFNNSGCNGTVQTNVTIKPLPATTAGNVCNSTSITLNATGGGTYLWAGPNGFSSSSQNPVITPVTNSNAGWYYVTVTGANGCIKKDSTQVVKDATCTLPIVLEEFNGLCDNTFKTFYWTTASEINNNFFSLERSKDAYNYEVITTVPGKGNTNSRSYYSYTEKDIKTGYDYYRLKQTDYNGSYTYSDIIYVSCGANNALFESITVYPNPANERLTVNFGEEVNSDLHVIIYDVTGRSVKEFFVAPGSFTAIEVSLEQLEKGVYVLSIKDKSNNSETPVQRFVKE